ncbi:MAG: hypothetical protein KI792_02950 [Alphaproteobacteria bacterium]|nr:hypothetical protein [Alphaproteobacteria bacterium SS10]
MRVPYAEGQFVRTNFPYKEAPTRPGERRIGYVAGIDRTTDPDNPTALVLYTTSSENWMRQNEGTLGFKQFTE